MACHLKILSGKKWVISTLIKFLSTELEVHIDLPRISSQMSKCQLLALMSDSGRYNDSITPVYGIVTGKVGSRVHSGAET